MIVITCPRCGGDGGEYLRDEDCFGPLEWHSCYYCCEEGVIKMEEEDFIEMVNMAALEAAAAERERQLC